ncbi:[Acyl-carrier-protein] S-malonyltransferase [Nitrosomonas cryotolerans]|uniref:Malonyl CoA-acyl carrier protein transacylase n=1 Tax=Nitrosomonas cryotolerans ATCC 49181 TaxID=1131553 RepID=A0A1N6GK27_9PROT|nr:ACP S-malonyltransferase [Nitrosomonas cryotolerans]SFP56235.1 [Acyl-carrier-protein] S-malonyltransferase [Nitrosomonas cryotolerans]SIO07752.1 [Acyl-carrier-protein] S-malonyltransferase [Nitrosomonas cryotolerans ATCC 49181]
MKFAFVFPGQGSQSIGMMHGYSDIPIVHQTFIEASDILHQDFWAIINDNPIDDLNLTINTQPLMLIAGIAVYRAWMSLGGTEPAFMAGHSLAEYTALVASEALTFTDALSLVRFRAQVMQQAVPDGTGGMAAILGLDDDAIRAVCIEVTNNADGESLEPANFNSPGQVVIAGHRNAVSQGIKLAQTKGAKRAVMLPMSIPSHCTLMKSAAQEMYQQLEKIDFKPPRIPIFHNVDVQIHQSDAAIRDSLVKQLYSPVRWADTIQTLAAAGVTHIAECGPGKVLTGLNKRIDRDLHSLALTDSEAIRQAINILK